MSTIRQFWDTLNKVLPQQNGSNINKGTISIFVFLSWLQVIVFGRVHWGDARKPSPLLCFQKQRQQPFDLVLRNQISARLPDTSVHHSGLHKSIECKRVWQIFSRTDRHSKSFHLRRTAREGLVTNSLLKIK